MMKPVTEYLIFTLSLGDNIHIGKTERNEWHQFLELDFGQFLKHLKMDIYILLYLKGFDITERLTILCSLPQRIYYRYSSCH